MQPRRDYQTRLFAAGSLLLALYFLLPTSQLGLGAWIDHLNFRLWYTLFPPRTIEVDDKLQLVALPGGITEAGGPSLASTEALHDILDEVADHGAAAIGVIPDLSPVVWPERDMLELLQNPRSKASLKAAEPYLQVQEQIQSLPLGWRIAPQRLPPKPLLVDREFSSPLLFNLHDHLLQYRFAKHQQPPFQVNLFSYDQGRVIAGFELSLLALARDTSSLRWQIPDQLRVGAADKPVSMYGSVRPWPQTRPAATLLAATQSQAELTDQNIAGKIVLLVDEQAQGLDQHLETANAIFTGSYSYSPWWQFLALFPITLLLWLYVLFAFRR